MRFLAAFAVFIFHYFSELKSFFPNLEDQVSYQVLNVFASKGNLGVNFFFVLSGFLITYLILHEIKTTQRFNYGHFLIRRALRIWPLYFAIVLIGFGVFPLLFESYQTEHQLINYIFFISNFDEIWYGAQDQINFLTSPWSVSVEEQFYFIWGLILFILTKLFLQKGKIKSLQLPTLIGFILIISIVFRWQNAADHRLIYYHTLSVMPDILIGALLAYFYFVKAKFVEWIKQLPKPVILLFYFLGLVMIITKNKLFSGELILWERYCTALFFAFIILDQIGLKFSIFNLGQVKVFNYLGKISYGLYMYHLVVLFLLKKLITHFNITLNLWWGILHFIIAIGLTVLISAISYRYFERPFLKLKQRY